MHGIGEDVHIYIHGLATNTKERRMRRGVGGSAWVLIYTYNNQHNSLVGVKTTSITIRGKGVSSVVLRSSKLSPGMVDTGDN